MLKGRIEHAKIFGDFFGEGDVTELEYALEGCLHDFEHIEEALSIIIYTIILVILINMKL